MLTITSFHVVGITRAFEGNLNYITSKILFSNAFLKANWKFEHEDIIENVIFKE